MSDPTAVRTSSMLWSEQVAIVEAAEAMDNGGAGVAGLAAMAEQLQPAIYHFGNRVFRRAKNPYE